MMDKKTKLYNNPSADNMDLDTIETEKLKSYPTQPDENMTFRFNTQEFTDEPAVGWLVGLNGDYQGECFELKSGKNFIGRNYDMDIALAADHDVSAKRHVVIIYEPHQRIFIAQPGDPQKQFSVNHRSVYKEIQLYPHDIIMVGKTKLMFFPLCGKEFSWEDTEKAFNS